MAVCLSTTFETRACVCARAQATCVMACVVCVPVAACFMAGISGRVCMCRAAWLCNGGRARSAVACDRGFRALVGPLGDEVRSKA